MVGDTVSHYRIAGKLGGGGMGVVYRAEDTRLGRPVALKFLPDQVAADSAMLDRFRREARAASAINHPHICTVYDIGEDGGKPFLAMEFLDGSTLKERIASGPIPADDVLDWATQIADALDAAHAAGIAHRDIKPANIFITSRSQAKILDFGLAKVTQTVPAAPSDATATVGMTQDLTIPGTTLGTIAYMSPEQARGDEIDAKTDVFSFGVVLYEMATGGQPFDGRTPAVVFNAILSFNPTVPDTVDPALAAIINRCLEKDPAKRASAREVYTSLRHLHRDSTSGTTPAVASSPVRKRSPWVSPLAAVICLAIGAAFYLAIRSKLGPKPARMAAIERLTANPAERPISSAVFSPDGRILAYSDPGGIRLRLASGETRLIPGTEGMAAWDWVPGGEKLLAIRQDPGVFPRLFQVSYVAGGGITETQWAHPSPDGVRTLLWREKGALVIEGGGVSRRLFEKSGEFTYNPFAALAWSPDGKFIAFTTSTGGGEQRTWSVHRQNVETGEDRVVAGPYAQPVQALTWAGPDRIVFAKLEPAPRTSDGNLWSVSGTSAPVRLTDNSGSSMMWITASADGRKVAVVRASAQMDVYLAPLEANGAFRGDPRRFTLDDRNDRPMDWTSDSKFVLFNSDRNGTYDIFRQAIDSDAPEPVVVAPGTQTTAAVTPGGTDILFLSQTDDGPGRGGQLMLAPVAGGPSRLLLESPHYIRHRCSAAGCVLEEAIGDARVSSLLDLATGTKKELFRRPKSERDLAVTRDGKRGASIVGFEFGANRIRIIRMADGSTEREIAVQGATNLNTLDWTADENGFYAGAVVVSGGSTLWHIGLDGKAKEIWQQPGTRQLWALPSPNGKHVAVLGATRDSNIWTLEKK